MCVCVCLVCVCVCVCLRVRVFLPEDSQTTQASNMPADSIKRKAPKQVASVDALDVTKPVKKKKKKKKTRLHHRKQQINQISQPCNSFEKKLQPEIFLQTSIDRNLKCP